MNSERGQNVALSDLRTTMIFKLRPKEILCLQTSHLLSKISQQMYQKEHLAENTDSFQQGKSAVLSRKNATSCE